MRHRWFHCFAVALLVATHLLAVLPPAHGAVYAAPPTEFGAAGDVDAVDDETATINEVTAGT